MYFPRYILDHRWRITKYSIDVWSVVNLVSLTRLNVNTDSRTEVNLEGQIFTNLILQPRYEEVYSAYNFIWKIWKKKKSVVL